MTFRPDSTTSATPDKKSGKLSSELTQLIKDKKGELKKLAEEKGATKLEEIKDVTLELKSLKTELETLGNEENEEKENTDEKDDTSAENENPWTNEDEKTLQTLLNTIESCKAELATLYAEQAAEEAREAAEKGADNWEMLKEKILKDENQEIKDLEKEIKGLRFYQTKTKKEKERILALKKARYESLPKELERISHDRQKKPFLYYAIEKSNNNTANEWFEDYDNVYNLENVKENGEFSHVDGPWYANNNEVFYDFNVFGFIKMIKNADKVDGAEKENLQSEELIFRIVGPNGETIADDVKGYKEATRIYNEKTAEYKEKLEKEFNKESKTEAQEEEPVVTTHIQETAAEPEVVASEPETKNEEPAVVTSEPEVITSTSEASTEPAALDAPIVLEEEEKTEIEPEQNPGDHAEVLRIAKRFYENPRIPMDQKETLLYAKYKNLARKIEEVEAKRKKDLVEVKSSTPAEANKKINEINAQYDTELVALGIKKEDLVYAEDKIKNLTEAPVIVDPKIKLENTFEENKNESAIELKDEEPNTKEEKLENIEQKESPEARKLTEEQEKQIEKIEEKREKDLGILYDYITPADSENTIKCQRSAATAKDTGIDDRNFYIPLNIFDKAWEVYNKKGNKGKQTKEVFIKKGGFTVEELDEYNPSWFDEMQNKINEKYDTQIEAVKMEGK